MKYTRNGDTVKATPEHKDDLWVLSQMIHAEDSVRASTMRKIKIGQEPNIKVVRKPMILTLSVEKTEFTGSHLRVLGTIIDGPQDISRGDHHSFTIEPHTTLSLTKDHWPRYLLDKLHKSTKHPTRILICVFSREDATFAIGSDHGYHILSSLKGNMPKKADVSHMSSDFFSEIAESLTEYVTRYKVKSILLASPAFWKEYLVEKLSSLPVKIVTSAVNAGGEQGVIEVLKRQEAREALSDVHVADELILVERILSALSKDEPVAYTLKDCEFAAEAGAIDTLLVTETYIGQQRQEGSTERIEKLMQDVDKANGDVHLIGNHEGGRKLDGLGSVAALLRYPIQ